MNERVLNIRSFCTRLFKVANRCVMNESKLYNTVGSATKDVG